MQSKLRVLNDALNSLGVATTWKDFRDKMDGFGLEDRKILIRKLQKDGYVDVIREKHVVKDNVYNDSDLLQRNYEGDLFIEQVGGYIKQKESNDIKQQEIIADLALRKKNDRRLILGTYLVAVGAIGLIFWEMIKTFCIEHHCACH